KSYINKARKLYILKQKYFGSVKNLTIITPSKWLFNLVKQSHLKNYPSKVIYNGIDLSVFYPRKDDLIYTKYNIPKDKKIILSVSFGWPEYKGYFYIEKLRMLLSDDYLILVVGQEKRYEKKGIQCIEKTYNQDDLAKIYSIANVFFNPTLQEVLGMVNIEALACGTPVVAFNTGGVPEIVDRYCGRIIESKDMEEVRKNIEYFCNYGDSAFLANACVNRAKTFNEKDKYKEYLELYENI
ncbi:glycosyltransferase, partial [Thomasclavelia spiroformis]|uniref:glycosyltransferase n=1 Tax=Thomasclavelia spiroformis TaxID=29348 RepID=UPI002420035A